MRELIVSQAQACWQEQIQKEAAIRANWNIRYGQRYLKDRTKPKKQPLQAPLKASLAMDPVPPSSKKVQLKPPETQWSQDQLPRPRSAQGHPPKEDRFRQARGATHKLADQRRPEDLDMKRVPSSTLKLLYQGISYDGQGRAQYFRERNQKTPMEKFQYPILSSWEYGWHVGPVMKNFRTPTYARVLPITKSFYTKNGIFHCPRRTDQVM
ncbi:protein ATP6V1FNB [Perognathus longimembris pacificus]|uniref:protein ATP6V1FNB n=1 Tax=Perognathus longimembris pacificus TaxID=214514 RepID=UPI0020196522|nr:protein ATP6V1FNB [Perognathus longimembris pacificus]